MRSMHCTVDVCIPACHVKNHVAVQGYDILLGADVCYSLKALPNLFKAASQLLTHKKGSKFLLGYVSR